jgi:hypothetical protein
MLRQAAGPRKHGNDASKFSGGSTAQKVDGKADLDAN